MDHDHAALDIAVVAEIVTASQAVLPMKSQQSRLKALQCEASGALLQVDTTWIKSPQAGPILGIF